MKNINFEKQSKSLSIILLILNSIPLIALTIGLVIIVAEAAKYPESGGWALFILALSAPVFLMPIIIQEIFAILDTIFSNKKKYIGAIICSIGYALMSLLFVILLMSFYFVSYYEIDDLTFKLIFIGSMFYFGICCLIAIAITVLSFINRKKALAPVQS